FPLRLTESHYVTALSRVFRAKNRDISGFYDEFRLHQDPSRKVTAIRGWRLWRVWHESRSVRHGDRPVCVSLWWPADGDPALAPGDWLSGRAPRSHRGGHWFDPSIAHPFDQHECTEPPNRATDVPEVASDGPGERHSC